MARVLVTGGTGFVGYWMEQTQPHIEMSHYMNRAGYDEGSWMNFDWDFLVHLAPISPSAVIEYCLHHDTRLLFASSGAVYERHTLYADDKRSYEMNCLAADIDVVIARLFTFYGEHLDADKAYSRFSKAAAEGRKIEIWGNGKTVRSYMHGSEMGKWLWAILLKGKSGEAYDVGSDVPVTMMELAQQINMKFGNRSEIVCDGRKDDCPMYLPKDTAKTRKLLE